MADATRLNGKVVLVTGGAGGIGAETLRLAGERGARLVVADINRDRASSLCEALNNDGFEAMAVEVDLSDETAIKSAVRSVISAFGQIDVLNNNAALIDAAVAAKDSNVAEMDVDLWDRSYAVNVRGAMLMARECMPYLLKTGGNIINTVSNLALQGHMVQCAYSSSKAALIQLTRSIAASHGRQGIRCNAVAPGMTMTPALKDAFPEDIRKLVEDSTLRDRLGEPDEIAEVIVWLASDAARNINGQVIVADGGLSSHVPEFGGLINMQRNQGAA